MPHLRDRIESRAIDLLRKNTSAKQAVYNMVESGFHDTMPIKIAVFSPRETIAKRTVAPRQYQRSLLLHVTIVARGEDMLASQISHLAREVEETMLSHKFSEGYIWHTELVGTENSIEDEGEVVIGAANIAFEVSYITDEDKPLTTKNLEGINAEVKN